MDYYDILNFFYIGEIDINEAVQELEQHGIDKDNAEAILYEVLER